MRKPEPPPAFSAGTAGTSGTALKTNTKSCPAADNATGTAGTALKTREILPARPGGATAEKVAALVATLKKRHEDNLVPLVPEQKAALGQEFSNKNKDVPHVPAVPVKNAGGDKPLLSPCVMGQGAAASPWFDPAGPLERDPTRAPPADGDRADAIAERAAVAEHEGKLPRDWAEALAALAYGPRPAGITEREWRARLEALWVFADRHARALHLAGWGFGEVFGVGEAWQRLDQRGAAWFALSATALQIAPDCLRWRTADGVARALWRSGCGPHVQGAEGPKSDGGLHDRC
jgi:hypothetical protein